MNHRPDNRNAHSNWLRVGRWSDANVCYSITKCVEARKQLLTRPEVIEILTDCLDYLRRTGAIRILAFCIMPDHLHLLFVLVGDKSLSEVMASFSRFTARKTNALMGRAGAFWQEGFFDRRCRDLSEIEDQLSYIEHNPVRAGWATVAEEWLYSSANPRWAKLLDRDWFASVC
jgi:REP element-mobilizing transposase RayT